MSDSDPISYFLEDMTHHGKSERTLEAFERVLKEFERFLIDRGETPVTAERRDCLAYIHERREDTAASTIATYATYLNRFYGYMNQVGELDANPMTLVMEELPESIDRDPTRRDLAISDMQRFVLQITHPLDRAVVVTFLKTGIRVGELCNLDLRDVGLTAVDLSAAFPTIGDRPAVREGTLYVDNDIQRGQVVNGEERVASNKRKRDTHIPIDDELRRVLRRWLAIRPEATTTADPLFVSTRAAWGRRLTPDMVRSIVTDHAEAVGWYQPGADAAENVTPHYFRHFFTTHLRNRIGDRGVVKYLRGDVADDVIDTYTHNWGNRVRNSYLDNMYSLIPNEES